MIIIKLTPIDYIQGSFSLILVIISFTLGIIIILKYFKLHSKQYIYVGISWIGMVFPWFPDALNFILIIVFQISLSPFICLFLGYGFLPFFMMCWLIVFTSLLYPNYQKIILLTMLIISIVIQSFFFFNLFTDINQIGSFVGPFQIRWSLFMALYLFFLILIIFTTGFLFSFYCLKSSNPEVNLKGKFLLIAFIFFTIAAVIEALGHLQPWIIIVTRFILIFSGINFYIGFIMPKKIEKFFTK
ncbi:MAG: hypothetical protein GF383_00470 [Candidatus Lokiarchaeota archaeon]|nr:hypothetical protein [Candidatus Lokiarchaeota archaeon]MBD3337630.1 hypothetical protein [Candidatus Lokiarchaeota archaeon]